MGVAESELNPYASPSTDSVVQGPPTVDRSCDFGMILRRWETLRLIYNGVLTTIVLLSVVFFSRTILPISYFGWPSCWVLPLPIYVSLLAQHSKPMGHIFNCGIKASRRCSSLLALDLPHSSHWALSRNTIEESTPNIDYLLVANAITFGGM